MINLLKFRSIAVPIDGAYFGQGTGTVLLNRLECNGTETNIGHCNKNPLPDNCTHSTDAGLMCLRKYYILGSYKMSLGARKPILGVSDNANLKPVSSATDSS